MNPEQKALVDRLAVKSALTVKGLLWTIFGYLLTPALCVGVFYVHFYNPEAPEWMANWVSFVLGIFIFGLLTILGFLSTIMVITGFVYTSMREDNSSQSTKEKFREFQLKQSLIATIQPKNIFKRLRRYSCHIASFVLAGLLISIGWYLGAIVYLVVVLLVWGYSRFWENDIAKYFSSLSDDDIMFLEAALQFKKAGARDIDALDMAKQKVSQTVLPTPE